MQHNALILLATGRDRPGIVDRISGLIFAAGCNLEDSRMGILGGEFSLMVPSGPRSRFTVSTAAAARKELERRAAQGDGRWPEARRRGACDPLPHRGGGDDRRSSTPRASAEHRERGAPTRPASTRRHDAHVLDRDGRRGARGRPLAALRTHLLLRGGGNLI